MSGDPMEVRDVSAEYRSNSIALDSSSAAELAVAGDIPQDWHYSKLGDALTLQRGFDLPHRSRNEGNIPVISSSGASGWHDTSKVDAPGVVTGRYGTIGEIHFVEKNFWPLNTTLYVRDFKGNDSKFVFYLLATVDFQSHSGKSGVPGVNRNDVHKEMIPLPPLGDQRAIAEALSDVDGLLEALDRLIVKKRAVKQAAMQQLLTGITRLPGFEGAWETARLGDVAEIRTGPFGSALHESDYVSDGIPIITVEHLGERGVVHTNLPRVSGADYKRLSAYKLVAGDIVFSRVGSVDRNALVRACETGWLFSGRLLRVRTSRDGVNSSYLSYYFQGASFKARIRELAVGQTMASLNTSILKGIEVNFPGASEQTAISENLLDMDSGIAALECRRDKTRELKQGMMQQLLTGRTRLIKPDATSAL